MDFQEVCLDAKKKSKVDGGVSQTSDADQCIMNMLRILEVKIDRLTQVVDGWQNHSVKKKHK